MALTRSFLDPQAAHPGAPVLTPVTDGKTYGGNSPAEQDQKAFYDQLRQQYPWIDQLGLDPTWVQTQVAQASGPAEITAAIRATSQYKKRFPGMFKPNGEQRMSEAEYFTTEDAYRQLLTQYNIQGDWYNPQSFAGIFAGDIDPNELKSRLDVYQGVKQAGQPIKDAFYVYAGHNITDADLYQAAIDPGYAQDLSNFYDQKTIVQPIDYATFIKRSTELGLTRVTQALTDAEKAGTATAGDLSNQVRQIDPSFASQVMDQLYTGGQAGQAPLSLQELLNAFQSAAIGGAATESGLQMPTLDRLNQFRQAGIDQTKAIQTYQQYGPNAALYNAAVLRARGTAFTQNDFENAQFLGNAQAARALQQGLDAEKAAGKESGSFRVDQGTAGQFIQRGFRRF